MRVTYKVPDHYSVRQLVYAYRFFKANPEMNWVPESSAWTGHSNTSARWFDWFYEKLTEKINRHFPAFGKGNRARRRMGETVYTTRYS